MFATLLFTLWSIHGLKMDYVTIDDANKFCLSGSQKSIEILNTAPVSSIIQTNDFVIDCVVLVSSMKDDPL